MVKIITLVTNVKTIEKRNSMDINNNIYKTLVKTETKELIAKIKYKPNHKEIKRIKLIVLNENSEVIYTGYSLLEATKVIN